MAEQDDGFDFIDDPFDPVANLSLEQVAQSRDDALEERKRQYVQARKVAYREVFTPGETSQAALDFVLRDLWRYCRIGVSTYHPALDGTLVMPILEGRRQVGLRIAEHLELSVDQLFKRYEE